MFIVNEDNLVAINLDCIETIYIDFENNSVMAMTKRGLEYTIANAKSVEDAQEQMKEILKSIATDRKVVWGLI